MALSGFMQINWSSLSPAFTIYANPVHIIQTCIQLSFANSYTIGTQVKCILKVYECRDKCSHFYTSILPLNHLIRSRLLFLGLKQTTHFDTYCQLSLPSRSFSRKLSLSTHDHNPVIKFHWVDFTLNTSTSNT